LFIVTVFPLLLVGDFNFPCVLSNCGFRAFNNFIVENNLSCCDELSQYANTYVNTALNQSSCIDHVFVNSALRNSIERISVLDSVNNWSDHRPISCNIKLCSISRPPMAQLHNNKFVQYRTRWDKAELRDYYNATFSQFQYINCCDCYNSCSLGCDCSSHYEAIDDMYENIVHTLQNAEYFTVPRVPSNSLKPFWNEYLDELKEKSVFLGYTLG
jgi:hypothetical protein